MQKLCIGSLSPNQHINIDSEDDKGYLLILSLNRKEVFILWNELTGMDLYQIALESLNIQYTKPLLGLYVGLKSAVTIFVGKKAQ